MQAEFESFVINNFDRHEVNLMTSNDLYNYIIDLSKVYKSTVGLIIIIENDTCQELLKT